MVKVSGVDYSRARPRPSVLASLGYKFVVRYLSYNTDGKNLSIAERDELFRAGLLIVLVWETTTMAALGGYAAGVAHAKAAKEQARALGAPTDVVIYFAVDFDPDDAHLSTVAAYMHGVCSVIPYERVGIYGGLRTVRAAHEGGWARHLWQTYAWSNGVWYPTAGARQWSNGVKIDGGDCDLDYAVTDYIGQWDAQGVAKDWDGDTVEQRYLDQIWNGAQIAAAMARGQDDVATMKDGKIVGPIDLRPFYDRIGRVVAANRGPSATLGEDDILAIATQVHELLREDAAKAMTLLGLGKASPVASEPPTSG